MLLVTRMDETHRLSSLAERFIPSFKVCHIDQHSKNSTLGNIRCAPPKVVNVCAIGQMINLRYFIIVSLIIILVGSSRALQEPPVSRRQVMLESGILFGGALIIPKEPASAARGAAELDLEFYVRDLVGGNKKEGNIESSHYVAPPPRKLEGPLLPLLLDNDCSPACIPVQALIQQVKKRSGDDDNIIAEHIQTNVKALREKSSRSFFQGTPWKEENVSDQYYFDITAYALWRTAAELLPNFIDRDNFARNVGKLIFEKVQSENLIKPLKAGTKDGLLVSTVPGCLEILDLFKSSQYCAGYRIRGDDTKDATADVVFDELDDESLEAAATVNCLVSVYEPATLQASLQITGEQSRFGPDYVGSTLAAFWDAAGIYSSWETYFIDPVYRSNPKDYFPNEQLFQYSLSKK